MYKTIINLEIKENNNYIICSLSWELDISNSFQTFKTIDNYINNNYSQNIIFNLKELKYMDSDSIRAIVDLFDKIENSKWTFIIVDANEWMIDVFELLWIQTIISIYWHLKDYVK